MSNLLEKQIEPQDIARGSGFNPSNTDFEKAITTLWAFLEESKRDIDNLPQPFLKALLAFRLVDHVLSDNLTVQQKRQKYEYDFITCMWRPLMTGEEVKNNG